MLKMVFLAILGIAGIAIMWKLLRCITAIIGTLVLLVILFCVYVWFGIQAEPKFYSALMAEEAASKNVEADSAQMNTKVGECNRSMNHKGEWAIEFTQDELNHWMAVEIDKKHPGTISNRVKDIRCQMDKDVIRVGARIDTEQIRRLVPSPLGFSGAILISADVTPRLVSPNVVDIELRKVRIGRVSLPKKLLLSLLEEKAKDLAIPFQVQYANGNPVIHVAFSDGELRRGYHPLVIKKLEVGRKKIAVSGETVE